MKKAMQFILPVLSIALNVFGILSLLAVNNIVTLSGLAFYQSMRLIVRYVIIIVVMAVGIISFSVFAGTFKGKVKNTLSICGCAYGTVLTLPLLYVFVGCFFAVNGATLPMVNEVAVDFQAIFPSAGVQYLIFVLGTLMSIIFLAVPILMTVMTVKEMSVKDLILKIKKK